MTITNHDGLNRLSRLYGITESYYDIGGTHHVASQESKQLLLKAMQVSVDCDQDIHRELEQIELRDWQRSISPVHVYQNSQAAFNISITLDDNQTGLLIHWNINEENGRVQKGEWQFEPHNASAQFDLDGRLRFQFYVELPLVSDIGYHRLKLEFADGSSIESLLIVVPETCFLPSEFEAGTKVWGINIQLFAIRSSRNWGIGDFTDLANIIKSLAPLGVDLIGLNPLHSLFPHLPENASPYSPSNRDFLNPVYLDVETMDEYSRCDSARRRVSSAEFQLQLQQLRDKSLVDYTAVWSIKIELFKLLFECFKQNTDNVNLESISPFRQYQLNGGEDLFKFGLFEAIQEFFFQQDQSMTSWKQWPDDFQNPESAQVATWAQSNTDKIEFHQYLQWRSEQQLEAIQNGCKLVGMRIGIYNDLAIGNESFSAQCWAEQSQYVINAGVGAPPDDFNLSGQSWGLPPQNPQLLKDNEYGLFIRTLRANMRHAGALRIDHVMGLMQLYWIPEGYPADQGTYVSNPFDDLLGILALESQRNQCMIVGEDLGTVPDEVRHQLWLKKILSFRILFFEKDWQHGSFKLPHEYPLHALCTSGSHDLPTLKEYWKAADFELREKLNLFPSEDIKHQLQSLREQDRQAIISALQQQHLITEEILHDHSKPELSLELFLSIQKFLARSQSILMMVPLEDILSQSHQINLPGTIDEYPNWRHKISVNLEDWFSLTEIERFAQAINTERNNNTANE
jgi:(1->4)-alpha-D-glucan 1-alpha-D-glucosylmutase